MLLAGKYLNVIRECGIAISNDTTATDEQVSIDDERCGHASSPLGGR